MENRFDELAKALAGGMSRRDAMRRIGGGLAVALLAPFALAKAGRGDPAPPAAVNAFCELHCRECVDPASTLFGICVSSCEVCYNVTGGTPCFCPTSETGKVACCIGGEVCLEGVCGE